MKLGDLVQIKQGLDDRHVWGVGLIVQVFPSSYENHAPFVSVFWPKVNRKTHNHTIAYIELIHENG